MTDTIAADRPAPPAPPAPPDSLEAAIEQAGAQITARLAQGNPPDVAAQIEQAVSARMAAMEAATAEALAQAAAARADLAAVEQALADRPPAQIVRSTPDLLAEIDAHRHNPHAPGAAEDGKWDTFAAFLRSAVGRSGPRPRLIPESGDVGSALAGEDLADGGALIPEEFRAQLMALMISSGMTIRSRATVLPMASATLTIPRIRDTDRQDGHLFGGVQTYWLEVGEDIPESEPEFGQVRLTAKALAALTSVQNTTLADSFTSLPALLAMMFSEAVNWRENQDFLRGSGAGRPLGILESDATISVARASGAPALEADDIHAMEGRLLPGSDQRAVYLFHPGLRADLGRLELGAVQYWQDDLSKTRPTTINGRMAIPFEHCSAPGRRGDIVLADCMYYLIGDRQAMSMSQSEHRRYERNATLIRCVSRLDGQPWIEGAITLAEGGADHTVSPFVTLADA